MTKRRDLVAGQHYWVWFENQDQPEPARCETTGWSFLNRPGFHREGVISRIGERIGMPSEDNPFARYRVPGKEPPLEVSQALRALVRSAIRGVPTKLEIDQANQVTGSSTLELVGLGEPEPETSPSPIPPRAIRLLANAEYTVKLVERMGRHDDDSLIVDATYAGESWFLADGRHVRLEAVEKVLDLSGPMATAEERSRGREPQGTIRKPLILPLEAGAPDQERMSLIGRFAADSQDGGKMGTERIVFDSPISLTIGAVYAMWLNTNGRVRITPAVFGVPAPAPETHETPPWLRYREEQR